MGSWQLCHRLGIHSSRQVPVQPDLGWAHSFHLIRPKTLDTHVLSPLARHWFHRTRDMSCATGFQTDWKACHMAQGTSMWGHVKNTQCLPLRSYKMIAQYVEMHRTWHRSSTRHSWVCSDNRFAKEHVLKGNTGGPGASTLKKKHVKSTLNAAVGF